MTTWIRTDPCGLDVLADKGRSLVVEDAVRVLGPGAGLDNDATGVTRGTCLAYVCDLNAFWQLSSSEDGSFLQPEFPICYIIIISRMRGLKKLTFRVP